MQRCCEDNAKRKTRKDNMVFNRWKIRAEWLVSKKNRLLQTRRYVDSVIESLSEFHIRKMQWGIDKLEEEGQEVRLWTIVETAGVNPSYMKAIAKEIRQILADKGHDSGFI